MQSALRILRVCCNQNELSVDPNKADARKTSTIHLKNVLFNGNQIKMVFEVKYLG